MRENLSHLSCVHCTLRSRLRTDTAAHKGAAALGAGGCIERAAASTTEGRTSGEEVACERKPDTLLLNVMFTPFFLLLLVFPSAA